LFNVWNDCRGFWGEPTTVFRWFDAGGEHRREDPIRCGSGRESLCLRHKALRCCGFIAATQFWCQGEECGRDAGQCQEIR
jgi:hypothetical protein